MKNLKYILATLVSMVCASCMQPFDLKLEDDPVIFLEAFPGAEDMVVFTILPAYANTNTPLMPEFHPHIVFTVNGEEIPVVQNTGYCVVNKYQETSYIADYKPVPGDKMRVEVTAEGFNPVYAETYIPELFPQRKVDYREVLVGGESYNVISVSIDDDPDTDRAYGIQVLYEVLSKYGDGSTERYSHVYAGGQISDDYDFSPENLEGVTLSFNGWHMHTLWGDLSAWDDDLFNGERKTMEFTFNGLHDEFFEAVQDKVDWEKGGKFTEIRHHKLVLYTMSEEFHKFAIAQNSRLDNAGMFAGLAPSNFCYSNVIGGYGAFAGVSVTETDWITPAFIENNR